MNGFTNIINNILRAKENKVDFCGIPDFII
jgi:hypothetical protein